MQEHYLALACRCHYIARRPHAKALVGSYTGADLPFGYSHNFMSLLNINGMAAIQHLKHLMLPWCFISRGQFKVGISVWAECRSEQHSSALAAVHLMHWQMYCDLFSEKQPCVPEHLHGLVAALLHALVHLVQDLFEMIW